MKKAVIILALVLTSTMTFAQDAPPAAAPAVEEPASKLAVAVDIVYPYLWRGYKLVGNKVAIQPYASYAITDKFTAGVWGTTNFSSADDSYNEFDWYVSYQVNPILKLMVSDYYYDTPSARTAYWDYSKTGTQAIDFTVALNFADKGVPVDFQWNTLIAGNDFNGNGDRNFSSYAEVGYTHSIESAGLDLRAFAGVIMSDDNAYYVTQGFTFTNVGLNIAKSIKFSDTFSVPVFVRYTYNDAGWVNKDGDLVKNFVSGGFTLAVN